jgi:hypothetical protein
MVKEEVTKIHNEAMDFAEDAIVAKRRGNMGKYQELIRKAFELEKQAANLLAIEYEYEPSRSILYRSAAGLALECDEFREAEKLASAGLAGDPPTDILKELREVLEQTWQKLVIYK